MGGVRVRLLSFTNSSEGYFSRFFSNGFLIKVNSKGVVMSVDFLALNGFAPELLILSLH